jgi:DNA polymerase
VRKKTTLDYETRSEVNLKKVGAYNYARHPSTEVLCLGYKIGDNPTKIWRAWAGEEFPTDLKCALEDPATELHAHNALFEQLITRYTLPRQITFSLHPIPTPRWHCTAAKAAAFALPRNLEGAGHAMNLAIQKDKEGHRLMLKWCKPKKPSKKNPSRWADDIDEYERLCQYCVTDVDAEDLLDRSIPDLPDLEREYWLLDQAINMRGIYVDVPLVKTALRLIAEETQNLNAELEIITSGAIETANKRAAILEAVNSLGVTMPNLQAKTIRDRLKQPGGDPLARRMLEIRASGSKTSTAKYLAFIQRAAEDSRVRDLLLFFGAHTGRWSGMGLQPHNFPQGTIKEIQLALEFMAEGDLELLRLIWGEPMQVLSSCLRGMIRSTPGREIFCADFSAIEARVLFWVAMHDDGLAAFRESRPLYAEMASKIFGKPVSECMKGTAEYDLGKRAVLGCGYQMGPDKFQATCEQYDSPISSELAETAVKAYRELHRPVVGLWKNMQRASILATANPGKKFSINRVKWFRRGDVLFCELPSGRCLTYHSPQIRKIKLKWGEIRDALYHKSETLDGRWLLAPTYGGRLTENLVQAIARDFMAASMLRIERAGYPVLLTVHDEVVSERKKGVGSLSEFEKLMSTIPAWGEGCPVKAEGWVGERYRK